MANLQWLSATLSGTMTIQATCPKGHTLTLDERLAGKKIRCPRCQSVFDVPELDDVAQAVSEKPLRRARPRDDDDDDEEEERRPRTAAKSRARDDDYDDD